MVLEVQIIGLGGPYHRFQIALLPSLIMPPFFDFSLSSLLRLMLPATFHLIKLSLLPISYFHPLHCIILQLHLNWLLREKKVISFYAFFFGNLLLMFLLYFKNMDGVAL